MTTFCRFTHRKFFEYHFISTQPRERVWFLFAADYSLSIYLNHSILENMADFDVDRLLNFEVRFFRSWKIILKIDSSISSLFDLCRDVLELNKMKLMTLYRKLMHCKRQFKAWKKARSSRRRSRSPASRPKKRSKRKRYWIVNLWHLQYHSFILPS